MNEEREEKLFMLPLKKWWGVGDHPDEAATSGTDRLEGSCRNKRFDRMPKSVRVANDGLVAALWVERDPDAPLRKEL